MIYIIQPNKPEWGTHLFHRFFIIKLLFVWTDAALALIADTEHIGLWILFSEKYPTNNNVWNGFAVLVVPSFGANIALTNAVSVRFLLWGYYQPDA